MIIKRKLRLSLLLTLALFTAGAMIAGEALAAGANWYNEDWLYRKQITINSSQVSGNLTNFPVLVNRTDPDWRDTANGGNVGQSDGGDILFTDSSGNKLSHEIEKYDPLTGELVAWVNVPAVSSSIPDTEIYIYYGNAGASDQWETDGSTWDSNFVMVQHLQESPTNGVPGHVDSTSNPNNGTPLNFDGTSSSTTDPENDDPSWDTNKKIDGADVFDGSDDYVNIGSDSSLNLTDEFTIMAWYNSDFNDYPGVYLGIVDKGNWVYYFGLHMTSHLTYAGHSAGLYTGTIEANKWTHFVWTHSSTASGDGWIVYIDGVNTNSRGAAAPAIDSSDVSIGRTTTGGSEPNSYFDGLIDEVRISNIARSADWIEASYNNQNDPSSFLTFSEEAIVIPTMTEWGMIIFMMLAGLGSLYYLRRQIV
jgi:MSHA biogenesis protein MshQ